VLELYFLPEQFTMQAMGKASEAKVSKGWPLLFSNSKAGGEIIKNYLQDLCG